MLLTLAACGTAEPQRPPAPPTPDPPATSPEVDAQALLLEADRRELGPAIDAARTAPGPADRRAALVAIARLHDLDDVAIAALRAGLRDVAPEVRSAASLGLGAMGSEAPRGIDAMLAGALAAETDPRVRGWIIRDLGRLATDRALEAVAASLRSDVAGDREAACLAAAERGIAHRPVSREIRGRLAALLDPSQPEPVRFACAYALARVPPSGPPDELRGETVALGAAVGDASPRVRMYAYRALARTPGVSVEVLSHGTEDEDWQVRVQAFRALGAVAPNDDAGARELARALRRASEALVSEGVVQAGGPVHTFLAGVEAAGPVARAGAVHDVAAELHTAIGRATRSRDQGLAHCAAAELVDRGRGWPSRVADCGGDTVEAWERAVLEARVLGSLEGAEPQRLVRLRHLMEDETPAVREATLAATAQIVHLDANELILTSLAIDDAGVRAAALEALTTVASRRPTETLVPPPLPGDRVREALRSAREATPDDELETLVTWVGAVEAADARELHGLAEALARHANRGVRDRARALLRAWSMDVPDTHGAVPNPIERTRIPDPTTRPRVRLETTRGSVTIELRPDEAPVTVARILGLVEEGFYDGLAFHRIVPAFVAQGGDPRGDGYGGPGWAQRCEDNRLPYDRGTVGMALAGRDTGGSQLFITHGPQPHLEGRYTAFGQVVEGMDVVDALQAGDRIRTASVSQ
ncbi:MAG: peptidylprolyl isomerase [Myxococcales bacterium]|nr:peptidylprolyl isomerase [Myxococcales bacterium]